MNSKNKYNKIIMMSRFKYKIINRVKKNNIIYLNKIKINITHNRIVIDILIIKTQMKKKLISLKDIAMIITPKITMKSNNKYQMKNKNNKIIKSRIMIIILIMKIHMM
jgi:hypothetical protein